MQERIHGDNRGLISRFGFNVTNLVTKSGKIFLMFRAEMSAGGGADFAAHVSDRDAGEFGFEARLSFEKYFVQGGLDFGTDRAFRARRAARPAKRRARFDSTIDGKQ